MIIYSVLMAIRRHYPFVPLLALPRFKTRLASADARNRNDVSRTSYLETSTRIGRKVKSTLYKRKRRKRFLLALAIIPNAFPRRCGWTRLRRCSSPWDPDSACCWLTRATTSITTTFTSKVLRVARPPTRNSPPDDNVNAPVSSPQRRPADQRDQQRDLLRRGLRHIFGARLHGARQRQVDSGRRHGGTGPGLHRLPGRHRHDARLHILGAHLLHDAAHARSGQLGNAPRKPFSLLPFRVFSTRRALVPKNLGEAVVALPRD